MNIATKTVAVPYPSMRLAFPAFLAFLALLLAACAADPVLPPRDCTPGTTSACVCLGAMTGVQTCTASGTVGACLCPDAGGSADVVMVADAAAADHVDVLIGTDPVPLTLTDVVDAGPGLDATDAGGTDLGAETGVGVCRADASACDAGCRDLQNDPLHCGACGNVCPAGNAHTRPVCFAGACTVSCDEGWRNCDRDMRNGCEVHVAVDRMNCGGCGGVCPLTEQCVMGTCRRP